jgi:uncharacterized protein (TIGR03118 family)
LKNPWGIAFSPTSPFWVSDQRTNVATLYHGDGVIVPLVVSIPGGGFPSGPTGDVFNGTSGFVVNGSPAAFMFATLQGTIAAWNGSLGSTAAIVVTNSGPASYTGLAEGTAGGASFIYAANFRQGTIDVFDSSFARATLAGDFSDPALPAGSRPYNIQNVGGQLYVEYALAGTGQAINGAGHGFVDIFNTNGVLQRRLISNGPLNSPWGVTLASPHFGPFSNELLVGNNGDGTINAFDPATGVLLGTLQDSHGLPIVNDNLWALDFGNGGPGFNADTLYLSAGINGQSDGLFASIAAAPAAAVPEPSTLVLLGFGTASLIRIAGRGLSSGS